MKCLAMIQARYGSSRLPGKIFLDLCGKPVLQRVVERLQKSKFVDEVVVVTSIDRANLPVLRLCADIGVRAVMGSEDDVLDRFYQTAKLLEPEWMVRVTADCPCYDWTILDQAMESLRPETDYLSDFDETLPDGLDIEIMRFRALETAWREAALASEREHVTQYIRKHPERFSLQNFSFPGGNFGHMRWTLDEAADFALIQAIYEHFAARGNPGFQTADILALLQEKPELQQLNAHIARNEGLAKSLREDRNDHDN